MGVLLSDIASAIESLAPPGLAEPWDRSGLQVGDPAAEIRAVVVSLDPSPQAVREAIAGHADLLLTHHPLFLRALDRVDFSTARGEIVRDLVRAGIGLYAAHTNLDRAEGGLNDALAERLGLGEPVPFGPGEELRKVVVSVPAGYEVAVRRALNDASGSRQGRYTGCSFSGRGQGAFTPVAGAVPFLGRQGVEEKVDEVRVEATVPVSRVAAVAAAIRAVHPYEEPVVDVYPLDGGPPSGGMGRVGSLPEALPLGEWGSKVARLLDAGGARLVGDPARMVQRVAVCGGSGASLWRDAQRAGADVLVTGDAKYHDAVDLGDQDFALLDVGHGPTERVGVEVLAGVVRRWSEAAGAGLDVREVHREDPFLWLSARDQTVG